MNITLWIAQVAIALLYVSGGAYKAFKFEVLAKQMRTLPHGAWRVLGVIEIVGGILLVVPAATGWMPGLTVVAAAVLALETFFLAGLYARQSIRLTGANPFVWAAAMGLMAAFVTYGRYVVSPLT